MFLVNHRQRKAICTAFTIVVCRSNEEDGWKESILTTVLTSQRGEKTAEASVSISQLPLFHAQGSRGHSSKCGITKYSLPPCFFSRISATLKKPLTSMPCLCLQEQTQYPSAWTIVDSSAHQVCMDGKCLITVFFLFCKGNSCSTWINFQSERPAFYPCLYLLQS